MEIASHDQGVQIDALAGHGTADAKFGALPPRPASIFRMHLIHRLQASRDRRFVSVVAPPGYGKTTALAQWAVDPTDPMAWMTIDDGDNDPVELFTDIALALDRLEPFAPGAFDGLRAPGVSVHSLVARLLAASFERSAPIRIVLDDAHVLTDRTSLDALAELIVRLPPGGQVTVVAREELDLPLPRWRTQGAAMEIDTDELAFDVNETTEMLRQLGFEFPPDVTAHIHRKAEGWPAGVYLAAVALQKHGSGAIDPVPVGDDRYVADYLQAEVLKSMDPRTLTFLRRTAILEDLSGPICDAVADVSDGAATLDALARINQMIRPLDSRRSSYRYHTLLREYLLADLERNDAAIVPLLHRRASAWFEEHGEPQKAIDHAFSGGDLDRAAILCGSIFMDLYYAGRFTAARALLNRFDQGQLHRYPWLAALGGMSSAVLGEVELADRMETIVDQSTYEGAPAGGAFRFESLRAMLRFCRGRGGVAGMHANADIAMAAEPADSPFRAFALNCDAVANLAADEKPQANARFIEVVGVARMSSASEEEQIALAGQALLAIDSGDWALAKSLVDQADAVIRAVQLEAYPTIALARAVSARVAIHLGDLIRAKERLADAALLRPRLTRAFPWMSVLALLELARAHAAFSDPAGARAVLRQAEDIVSNSPNLGSLADDVREFRKHIQTLPIGVSGASTLTTSELRVLGFLPLHLSFREIGERLGVKPSTVKTHVVSIYGKLGASSRTEAILLATAAGLLEGSSAML